MINLLLVLLFTASPQWWEGDLEGALKKASSKQVVLVDVYADWCSPCNQLAMEVLDADAGKKLLKKNIGVKVDFESEEGIAVTKRYGVLSLPTTLVLRKDGTELGRVEGYPGPDAYVKAIAEAVRGRVGLAALKKIYLANPGDMDAMITYAQSLLVSGDDKTAWPLLRKAIDNKGSLGARAARIWGRWLLRVKRNYPSGTAHFAECTKRFKGTKWAGGFRYWHALGLHMDGKAKLALAVFDRWIAADPVSGDAHLYKANFMVNRFYDLADTSLVISGALGVDDGNSWLHYLKAVVLYRQADYPAANLALNRALSIKPKKAIFKNLQTRISLSQGRIPKK